MSHVDKQRVEIKQYFQIPIQEMLFTMMIMYIYICIDCQNW